VIENLGDLEDEGFLTLRARQTDNWGHASINRVRKKNDFLALYRADADEEDIHGVRRFDIARLLCPIRITLPCDNNSTFDVAFVQNYKRLDFSERFRSYRYRTIPANDRSAYSVEDIRAVFRPVHMTPQWDENNMQTMYLNPKTDLHAWMNLY
jgi:hypothetical protein